MWKFTAKNAYPSIILHDCFITKVSAEDEDIIFGFDNDGFWVMENNTQNPYGMTLQTDGSEIRFSRCDRDFTSIDIFKALRLFGKPVLTRRKELTIEEFASKINSGQWKFEIVNELYAYNQAVFIGYLYFGTKPYHVECQLQIYYQEMVYHWNNICEDKPW